LASGGRMDTVYVAARTSITAAFLQGIGVLVGIVVGTVITIATRKYWERRQHKDYNRMLLLEFTYNINKVGQFKEVYENLKSFASAGGLTNFYGYLSFHEFLGTAADKILREGYLYEVFDTDDISDLLEVYNTYVMASSQQFPNTQINDLRQNFDQQKALATANYWIERINKHKKTLNRLSQKLQT
jgi:hypothetical protein